MDAQELKKLHEQLRSRVAEPRGAAAFAPERPAAGKKPSLADLHAAMAERVLVKTEADECEETVGMVLHRQRLEKDRAALAAMSDRKLRRSLGLAPKTKDRKP